MHDSAGRAAMETEPTPPSQGGNEHGRLDERWPALPLEAWSDTCDTLHMWVQIVGKVKLTLSPFQNEWWQVAFQPTARGLATGPIPSGEDRKSTRLNSSHVEISYAVFCLK